MIPIKQQIEAYKEMITSRVDEGWQATLLTFMFHQINGGPRRVASVMQGEVERVYATALTRIVRDPRAPGKLDALPVWLGAPDYPVFKHEKMSVEDATINDGRHIHVVVATPPSARLRTPLADHFMDNAGRYVREPLLRLHAVEITKNLDKTTGYALKAVGWDVTRPGQFRVEPEDIILLPRALSELACEAWR